MFELILWLLPPFILVLLVIKWLTGWAARTAARDIETKIRAAEMLVNAHRLPDEWLTPYRIKLRKLQTNGAAENQITRVLESARKDCLQRISRLVDFFKQGAFADSPATRDTLVSALQAEYRRLENQDWQAILDTEGTQMNRES